MTNPQFAALLAAYTGSLVLASVLITNIAKSDEFDDTAMAVAREYACEWAAPASLAPVLAMGIPEDIAVEVVADAAWMIVETTPPDIICPETVVAALDHR